VENWRVTSYKVRLEKVYWSVEWINPEHKRVSWWDLCFLFMMGGLYCSR